jgi:hypothetical protein
MNYFI